jgi:hypothetical protein
LAVFAGDSVRLHALDVGDLESVDERLAQQRLDVRLDPALVHSKRRGFDRSIAASKDATGIGFLKITIAQGRHGRLPPVVGLLGRIITLGKLAHLHFREVAGGFHRDYAEAPELRLFRGITESRSVGHAAD